MGERRQRPVSGEAETNNAVFWSSDEAAMLRDPLGVRPRMKRGDGLVCSHVLLEIQ
jgi:hypothetical protein